LEEILVMNLKPALIFIFTLGTSTVNLAATEFGTAEQARAMLGRAILALQYNKQAAIKAFNDSDGEFRDRDLYVFCAGSDGLFTAHPRGAGRWSLRGFEDISGEAIGEEMYSVAAEGKISEVTYLLTRGNNPLPYEKTSLITKIGDQICGVGYYNKGQRTRSGNLTVNSSRGVVIDGYDAVAYFTLGQATKGTEKFSYQWLGAEWHFVNAEHRQMFIVDPNKFTPQYGGYCATAMSEGHLVPIDPESWQIVDGKLYLHYSKRSESRWSQDQESSITSANTHWQKIKPGLSN